MRQTLGHMTLSRDSIINKGPFKCYVTQMGVGGVRFSGKKALRRCKVQCYLRYEGVGVGPISRKKHLNGPKMEAC